MLRLVYRSYGGENWKNRPPFYSKRLALASFLRALEALVAVQEISSDVEVLFVNDGPVPDELADLMRPAGKILQLPGVGMRRSYSFGVRLPELRGWADDDLVWYSEDDYLYHPDAFVRLVGAAEALPEADYFALYGLRPEELPPGLAPRLPRGWTPEPGTVVAGQQWRPLLSTASTFGARAGALKRDAGIFRFCMVPHRSMYRDHDTCVVVQGYEPHGYAEQLRNLAFLAPGSVRERVRGAWLAPFLLATNLRSHRRRDNRRLYLAARPCLAAHLEIGQLPPNRDWEQVAKDVEEWAKSPANRP
jgi:hypothetical protein